MKIRNLCALLLALMLLALAGCGQKEQPTQPENPDVPQEEAAAPVRLVCSNGSTTLRFSREEDGHWLWADDKTFPLDESYALTLLETVQGIESLPPVTTAAQLADYGLESSAKYVTLTDSQDTSVTYRLGSESDGSVYVYRGGAGAPGGGGGCRQARHRRGACPADGRGQCSAPAQGQEAGQPEYGILGGGYQIPGRIRGASARCAGGDPPHRGCNPLCG